MGQLPHRALNRTTGDPTFPMTEAKLLHDPVTSLRLLAEDMQNWNGYALIQWDAIRAAVETHKGSDAPRLMFEAMMETYAEAITKVADALSRTSEQSGICP